MSQIVTVSEPKRLSQKPEKCYFCQEKLSGKVLCPKCGTRLDDIRCIEIIREKESKEIDNALMIGQVNHVLEDRSRKFSPEFEVKNDYFTFTNKNESYESTLLLKVTLYFVPSGADKPPAYRFAQIARHEKIETGDAGPLIDLWKKENPGRRINSTIAIVQKKDAEKHADVFGMFRENEKPAAARDQITIMDSRKPAGELQRCPFCSQALQGRKVCPKCGTVTDHIRCVVISRGEQIREIDNQSMIAAVNRVLEDRQKKFGKHFEVRNEHATFSSRDESFDSSLLLKVTLFYLPAQEDRDGSFRFAQIARFSKVDLDGAKPIVDSWMKQHPNTDNVTCSIVKENNHEKRADVFVLYRERARKTTVPAGSSNELDNLFFNPLNRLKSVSDESLRLANLLLEKGFLCEVSQEQGVRPKIRVIYKKPEDNTDICDLKALSVKPGSERGYKDFFAGAELIRQSCPSCPNSCDNCLLHTAAYLFILKKNGRLEEALRERSEYFLERKKSGKCREPFLYNWAPADGLRLVGSYEYETARRLAGNNLVSLSPAAGANGLIRVNMPGKCFANPEIVDALFFDRLMSEEKISYIQPGITADFNFDHDSSKKMCQKCKLENCPFLVAGYIQYLKMTGSEEEIGRDRALYQRERDRLFKETTAEFNEVARRAEGTEKILKFVNNEMTDYLYCIIQGSDDSGRRTLIDQIAAVLHRYHKISSGHYEDVTFGQLEEKLTAAGNDTGYSFSHIPESTLFVVSRLDRFLDDVENGPRGKGGKRTEFDAVKLDHLVRVLGTIRENTYVILVSQSEEETHRFLRLNNRYRYLYADNLIRIPDYSPDELFLEYLKGLSGNVSSRITDHEAFREEFIHWIGVNRKFVPFANSDLSRYLANFSNMEGRPVLPENFYNGQNIRDRLNMVVGMDAVKDQIRQFENFVKGQQEAAVQGIRAGSFNMHMMFLGNPGTGKTMIARIIAEMLYEIGVLRQPKLVEAERKDLVGRYVGETAPKTAEKIKEALGGVLFIDEAYTLANESGADYGHEAIATLVKAMEDHKDDLVVIFAGYEKEMGDFIDANSGISSRIGYTFHFRDYSAEDLTEMFRRGISSRGFELRPEALERVEAICAYFARRKNFGNGRFIEKLQQRVIQKHYNNAGNRQYRVKEITMDDIPLIRDLLPQSDGSGEELIDIDAIVGMNDVKDQIDKFARKVEFEKKAQSYGIRKHFSNKHMVFLGNPGTGKTMMARVVAQKLYEVGAILENKMVETDREGLIARYVGQTAAKTRRVIESAMGGVLFIDEAYALAGGSGADYGHECIATLIKAMDDQKDNLVVIFAGYEKEMKAFLDVNPGISSRIGYTILFEDYSVEELTDILTLKLKQCGYGIGAGVEERAKELIQYFIHVPNFGNGRFAEKVASLILEKHAERCLSSESRDEICIIGQEDMPAIEETISKMPNGENMIRPSKVTQLQNERTAYHELGHAFLQHFYFPEDKIRRITISAEGNGALGYVERETETVSNSTATQLRQRISVLLGGLASEEIFLGEYATGGQSDLQKATSIAQQMITRYGMSRHGMAFRDKVTDDIQAEINELLDAQFKEAKEQLAFYKDKIGQAKAVLMEKRSLDEEELVKIMSR